MQATYHIPTLIKATEASLYHDIYLIVLHASRVPPHLLVSVNGKIFTLSVKGATVDGELAPLLALIRRKNIETVFVRLALPSLFTTRQLKDIMRRCILAYPRVDADFATCLTPISDFCHSAYRLEKDNVNVIFDLLSRLNDHQLISGFYHLNLEKHLVADSFSMKRYSVADVHEAITAVPSIT